MGRAKALLVDSDTLSKWIFNSGSHPPVITPEEALQADFVRFVAFPAVADIYQMAFFTESVYRQSDDPTKAESFRTAIDQTLFAYFHSFLNVVYGDHRITKDWLDFAKSPAVHEKAHRDHLWVVSIARELVRLRFAVTIASEEPDVYVEMRDLGHLNEVAILKPRR